MSSTWPSEPNRKAFVSALLEWYDREARDLPWRRTRDPYAIWVSEILLQQTRVETVLEYYPRFLEAFPTVEALARASLDHVLKLWEGLGYYARARHLHEAARRLVETNRGQVPRDPEALVRLPGIGRSTAGAIASIAFGVPVPVLDGNVRRVLCRWAAWEGDPLKAPLRERLWELASALVPAHRPGDYNQALMDLGARICTPRSPTCKACPVQKGCLGYQQGRAASLPTPRISRRLPHQ